MLDEKYKVLILLLFILTPFFLSSCQEPKEMSIGDVCQVENDGLLVTTDGYFSINSTLYCSDASGKFRCGLTFNSYPDGDIEFSAEVREGKRRNQMVSLESGYLEEDLQIKTADGSYIGVGVHVWITGELYVTEDECSLYVDKIELFED